MSWEPDRGPLEQLVQVLRDSEAPNTEIQNRTYKKMAEFHQYPDYSNYLVYVFTKLLDPAQVSVRHNAGLQLKNNMSSYYNRLPGEVQDYIRHEVLQCLGDDSIDIRNTAAQVISAILEHIGFELWPSLLPDLARMLEHDNLNFVHGSLTTLDMLCEDLADDIEAMPKMLGELIVRFMHFFKSEHEEFRVLALKSVVQFIIHMPEPLRQNINVFLEGIFFLATHDGSARVRKLLCEAFASLVVIQCAELYPHIDGVINFMLQATMDEDELVAYEACEFWGAIASESGPFHRILLPNLDRLLSVLINRMVYTQSDLEELDAEEDDCSVPDRPEDMPPRFRKSRDNQEEVSQFGNTDWTVRKCAAFALDMLAGTFRKDLLAPLIPLVNERMSEGIPWQQQEVGILAIGAVAHGCYIPLNRYLPNLMRYLIHHLGSDHQLILTIACWSTGQYSRWVCENKDEFLKPILERFLHLMHSRSKRVQEAACSALSTLSEEAGALLRDHIEPILHTVIDALGLYQAKNLIILYDTISSVAEGVSHQLSCREYAEALLPALMQKWTTLDDTDRPLLALLQCVGSVCVAVGIHFEPYVCEVFQRCLRLIEHNLIELSTQETQERDFLVCSLDLLSSLMDSMREGMESLVGQSNLLRLLYEAMKDKAGDVKQSAFALVGDIAKFCPLHLVDLLEHFVPMLVQSVEPVSTAASNNACWALGEVTFSMNDRMSPYAPSMLEALLPVLQANRISQNVSDNAAITLGRLANACPDVVAHFLPQILVAWCKALSKVRAQPEKAMAFQGLCFVVSKNPEAALPVFGNLCLAIGSWGFKAPDELKQIFHELFKNFHQLKPGEWDQFMGSLDPALLDVLRQYGV